VFRRNDSHLRTEYSPHASGYFYNPSTIFKYACALYINSLADNLPQAALEHPKKLLRNPIGHAYTEVVHMSWQIMPHALTTSCDAAAAIFDCVCAKRVTYFGRNTTSCVETSEDAWPTIFNQMFHRNESPDLAILQPHAFEKLQYPSAIFRHTITRCFHNRADNQSSAFKTSENISSAECPAYTEVVHMA
jgi:hypothetical protein